MNIPLFARREKQQLTPEQLNLIALRKEYQIAIDAYHAAVDTYNFASCGDSDSEDVLYRAMILARDNVDNIMRLIKINTST